MENSLKSKFIDLEWLRGLAALFVVLLHSREIGWIGFRSFWESMNKGDLDVISGFFGVLSFPIIWGSIGVSIFFVLSGYVIHLSASPIFDTKGVNLKSVFSFYLRRLFRIYPVLIISLLITLIFDRISIRLSPEFLKLGDLSAWNFFGNIIAFQGVGFSPYGSNGPLWSLAIEIQFYLIYPLLYYFANRHGISKILPLIFLISTLSWWILSKFNLIFFTSYFFCWVIGCYVAEVGLGRIHKFLSRHFLFFIFLASLFLGCGLFFLNQFFAFNCWSISCAAWLLWYLDCEHHPLQIKALSFLGRISYSLYATHEPLIVLMFLFIFNSTKFYSILLIIPFIFGSIFLSYLVNRLIEAPSHEYGRKLASKLFAQ